MVARDRPYSELKDDLIGKKVVIWTCNTCARLCNGIGGTDAAEKLSEALRKDGIDVLGVMHTSASCLEGKLRAQKDEGILSEADVILSLTCNIGALCAKRVFDKDVLNPLATLGAGFIGEGRIPYLCYDEDGELKVKSLDEASSECGFWCDPYV